MKRRIILIVIAFSMSFISMVALSLFSMERFTNYSAYNDLVDHTNIVINKILKTEIYLSEISRAECGYMITRDTMYLSLCNNVIDSTHSYLTYIGALIKDNSQQQNKLSLIKSSAA